MTRKRPVRVLMLLENNPYPRDVRVSHEARALTEAGFDVTVISPKPPGRPWRESVDGVHAYRYPAPRPGDGLLGYLWEYAYTLAASAVLSLLALSRRGFDVVHAHNPPDTFFLIGGLYRILGKRFIFDHHDLSPEMYLERFPGGGNRLVYRVLLWLERQSFRLATHVITTNESYREIAMTRGGIPDRRITVVRNAPDLARFSPGDPKPVANDHGVALLGYLGQMGVQDGIDYLLRSLVRLRTDQGCEAFHCLLVGDGPARTELEELALELGLGDHTTFTGYLSGDELLQCLRSIDVGLCPEPKNEYTDRSTVVKLAEYMALAKPIVAFDLREHRFTAADAALYATPNDELDFARCIQRLLEEPELRERLGQRGRQRVENRFSWERSVEDLLQAYRSALDSWGQGEHVWE